MAYDYNTADPFYYGLLREYAAENRKFQTDAERMLWRCLSTNKLGIHFRRQHIIGCYIADFVCLRKRLIIEVDGGYHSQKRTNSQGLLSDRGSRTYGIQGFEI